MSAGFRSLSPLFLIGLAASVPDSSGASLPEPWTAADIGGPTPAGSTRYDDKRFVLEAGGTDIAGGRDQFHFVHTTLASDGTLVARFVAPTASSSSKFGLMFRAAATPHAPHIAVLLSSSPSSEPERPNWNAQLVLRERPESTRVLASINLSAFTESGRLTKPCWLRLSLQSGTLSAAYSANGVNWTTLGAANVASPLEGLIGLAACSRVANGTTTVVFDEVKLTLAAP